MKIDRSKLTAGLIPVVVILFCAAGAMAVDVDFSGEFRIRGVMHDNPDPSTARSQSRSWFDTRLWFKPTLIVNDRISLITSFTALDNLKFGWDIDDVDEPDTSWVKFDSAYVNVKTPYGVFSGGRMIGSQWGPSAVGDSNIKSRDRLMWNTAIDDRQLHFGGFFEKHHEHDFSYWNDRTGMDNDRYAAFVQHKGENLQIGLLASFSDFKSRPPMRDLYRSKKRFTPPLAKVKTFTIDPYVAVSFGRFSFFAEALYVFGEAKYQDTHIRSFRRPLPVRDIDPIDISAGTFNLEGKYRIGPASLRAGLWYMSGDDNTDDDKMNAMAYFENSEDMDTLLILTGNTHELDTANSLGGLGNFSADAFDAFSGRPGQGVLATAGARAIYVGVDIDILENLHLSATVGHIRADKPPSTRFYDWHSARWSAETGLTDTNFTADWDDDVGNEVNLSLSWFPMDQLEYKVTGGYLDAGDFWKQGGASEGLDEMYTLLHSLTVTF